VSSRGVSPVVGTLLLVMIVVVLAAALAAYTTGLVYRINRPKFSAFLVNDAPEELSPSGGDLVVAILYGGEPLACKDLEFQIINLTSYEVFTLKWNDTLKCFVYNLNGTRYDMYGYGRDVLDSFLTAGDMVTFNETVGLIKPGTPVEFRVIYLPSSGVIYDKSLIVT